MTKPQLEMLISAIGHRSGKLNDFGAQRRTVEMLSGEGLIVRGFALTEAERIALKVEIDGLISSAREVIGDDWEDALACLKRAKGKQFDLDRQCWWVTDKAREVVAVAQRG